MSNEQNNAQKVGGLNTNYVLSGKAGEVKHLIYHHHSPKDGEVVVYVDYDLELDWECDDKAGELINAMPLKVAVRKILNGVAALEPLVHSWPKDLKLTSKRLMGEAIASVLRDDVEGAEVALENAKKFVREKSKQVSRYWTLQGCLVAGFLAAVAGGIEILNRIWIAGLVGRIPFLLSLCFWAGCLGALLFVVLRFGTQPKVDSTAEKHLHYLEAIARIVGGGIAGVLVGGMVKLGLILPVFEQAGMETLAMCAAAMIAGASERLAAGIVTKVENNETTKEENENADN
jgi:hypothetical protein